MTAYFKIWGFNFSVCTYCVDSSFSVYELNWMSRFFVINHMYSPRQPYPLYWQYHTNIVLSVPTVPTVPTILTVLYHADCTILSVPACTDCTDSTIPYWLHWTECTFCTNCTDCTVMKLYRTHCNYRNDNTNCIDVPLVQILKTVQTVFMSLAISTVSIVIW